MMNLLAVLLVLAIATAVAVYFGPTAYRAVAGLDSDDKHPDRRTEEL